MRDIGHLEFGELHRPIAFDGIDDLLEHHTPDTLDYWVGYWTLAFEHVLRHRDEVVLVGYEKACEEGVKALQAIGERLEIGDHESLANAAGLFRAPHYRAKDADVRDKDLLQTAYALHESLSSGSIV